MCYFTAHEHYIKAYNGNGELQYSIPIDGNYKHMQNDIKIFDEVLKSVNLKENRLSIKNISEDTNVVAKLSDITKINDGTSSKTTSIVTFAYAQVSRSLIQTTVKSYWSCNWYCNSSNYTVSNSGWTSPRYITAANTNYRCIPYNCGGWDTHAGFLQKIQNYKTAGNINTNNVFSSYAGVNCSGYVQRCWGINDSKKNTTMLDSSSISGSIAASQLKFGDVWNSSGHIMIYEKLD